MLPALPSSSMEAGHRNKVCCTALRRNRPEHEGFRCQNKLKLELKLRVLEFKLLLARR